MTDTLRDAYEAAPYHNGPVDGTHVSQLETMALLHGVAAAPNGQCRALELGGATGGNVIAMAYGLPESTFVGIDLAPGQVADGMRAIAALGLTNIELRAMSIADVGPDLGLFDYIICHGVYSWVPPEVQDAILRVCSRNLAPNGVAYVSYNTYPGWHAREMLRDMLMFHDDPTLAPAERVARARAFADALAAYASPPSPSHSATLIAEVKGLRLETDTHLLHEQLEPFNHPVYFAEFVRRAAAHRLQYLNESMLSAAGRSPSAWVKDATGTDPSDVIRSQQYLDFVVGRTFRSSLLCHDSVTVRDSPSSDQMPLFHFWTTANIAEPSAEDAAKGELVASFRTRSNTLTTNVPLVIAALRSLIRVSPAALTFDELLARVDDRLRLDAVPGLRGVLSGAPLATSLSDAMLGCAQGGLVRLDRRAPRLATRVSARPRASAIAREQARRTAFAPSLQHGKAVLGAVDRLVLVHLDGTRTSDDLLDMIQDALAAGAITIDDGSRDRAVLAAMLGDMLKRFAASALLEA